MKKIGRILNIRKHKFVVFVDAYTNAEQKEQLLFDRNMFLETQLKLGDCFAMEGREGTSKNGQQIFNVDSVLWVSPTQNWELARDGKVGEKGYSRYAQENALNAGNQVKVFKLKNELIKRISELLDSEGFESVKCQVLEPKRTASLIPPFETKTRLGNEELYLRITPENQLKQMSAILLKSVYTIDNVFYNKHADAKHQPETCTLEFVGLDYSKQELLRLITRLSQISYDLCEKYGFETDKQKLPEIIDYADLESLGIKYQRRIPEFKNTILINVPVNSPFIHCDEKGGRSETRWYLNGSLTAHGYEDEINTDKVQQALQKQKQDNQCDDVNEMQYFNWGLPKSFSFGLGIDAMVCRYLNLPHMSLASNPLGINYTSVVKQEQKPSNVVKLINLKDDNSL